MTKTDVVKWLQREKDRKLSMLYAQNELNEEALQEEWRASFSIDSAAEQIFPLLEQISTIWAKCKKKMDKKVGFRSYSYGFDYRLNSVCYDNMEDLKDFMVRDMTMEGEWHDRYRAMQANYSQLRRGTETNYDNVIQAVKCCKNAKIALDYLKELGFDVSPLRQTEDVSITDALAIPVDAAYLFLDKKEDAQ